MFYRSLHFSFEEKKSYLIFNELTLADLSFRQDPHFIFSKERYTEYLHLWLKSLNLNSVELDSVHLFEDDDSENLNEDYHLIIDEKNSVLKIREEHLSFNESYQRFLDENTLWNGVFNQSFDSDLSSISFDNPFLEEYLEDCHYRIQLLRKVESALPFSQVKDKFYFGLRKKIEQSYFPLRGTQLCRLFKKLGNVWISEIKESEQRLNRSYSKKVIEVRFKSEISEFSLVHSQRYVDDGHNYYLAHDYGESNLYNYSHLYEEKDQKELIKYVFDELFDEELDDECDGLIYPPEDDDSNSESSDSESSDSSDSESSDEESDEESYNQVEKVL